MESSWGSDGPERLNLFYYLHRVFYLIIFLGSCALEYRLVRVPKVLQDDDSYVPGTLRHIIDRTWIIPNVALTSHTPISR